MVSLQQTVEGAEGAVNPASYSHEQLRRDYAADAASFNTLLSTVGGAGESYDIEAAQGFIPGPGLTMGLLKHHRSSAAVARFHGGLCDTPTAPGFR